MGCCFSSTKRIPRRQKPPVVLESDRKDRGPLPTPHSLEETVKEVVLSETLLAEPQQNPKEDFNINTQTTTFVQEAKYLNFNEAEEAAAGEIISQASPLSDTHSICESFSTITTATTTTVTTTEISVIKDDDDDGLEAVSRELRTRSPAPRKRPYTGEVRWGAAKSPAKRADSTRIMSLSKPRWTVPRDDAGLTGVKGSESTRGGSCRRRVTGTASGTRRRSPGGRSGGRLLVSEENEGEKKGNDAVLLGKSEVRESLVNPHASLECFIFL